MNTKTVYLFDELTGAYAGPCEAHQSPEDPLGVFMEPTCSTDIEPPIPAQGETLEWTGASWLVIPAPPPPLPPQPVLLTPQQQIDTIERSTLMNRATREFLLGLAEEKGAAAGLTPSQLYAANPGYHAVKDVDNQIVAVRALL